MSNLSSIEDTIQIRGILPDGSIETITPSDLQSNSQLFPYERVKFTFVSPVPSKVQNLFNSKTNLNTPRAFASVTIQPQKKGTFEGYLNTERYGNVEEYRSYLEPFLADEKVDTTTGILKEVIILTEFRREYTPQSFNENRGKATYSLQRTNFRNAVRSTVKFERARLLNTNWGKNFGKKLLNTNETARANKKTGKEVFFLYKEAGVLLWDYVEKKLNAIGIKCIVLDADNLTLAYKIYGPSGYYPMLRLPSGENNGLINTGNSRIKITGNKSEKIMLNRWGMAEPPLSNENKKRLITCDNTPGPKMFKLLDDSTPTYDWSDIKSRCTGGTTGGKRKTRKAKK